MSNSMTIKSSGRYGNTRRRQQQHASSCSTATITFLFCSGCCHKSYSGRYGLLLLLKKIQWIFSYYYHCGNRTLLIWLCIWTFVSSLSLSTCKVEGFSGTLYLSKVRGGDGVANSNLNFVSSMTTTTTVITRLAGCSNDGIFLYDRSQVLASLTSKGMTMMSLMTSRTSSSLFQTIETRNVNNDDPCANGALLAEQAIPGAYNQECMSQTQRIVPIRHTDYSDKINGSKERTSSSSSSSSIVIRQQASGSGRTGMAVWNSGLLLVRLLQILPSPIPPSSSSTAPTATTTILELGCGTGLASIAAAKLGLASTIIATDGNPDVLTLTGENIQQNIYAFVDNDNNENNNNNNVKENDSHPKMETQVLSWGLLSAIEYSEVADLVLGSDLTYNSGTWRNLAETMVTILKPDGYVLYVTCGHEGFPVQAECDGFLSVAKAVGLESVSELYGIDVATVLPTLLSTSERIQLQNSGGARVLVLQRKRMTRRG